MTISDITRAERAEDIASRLRVIRAYLTGKTFSPSPPCLTLSMFKDEKWLDEFPGDLSEKTIISMFGARHGTMSCGHMMYYKSAADTVTPVEVWERVFGGLSPIFSGGPTKVFAGTDNMVWGWANGEMLSLYVLEQDVSGWLRDQLAVVFLDLGLSPTPQARPRQMVYTLLPNSGNSGGYQLHHVGDVGQRPVWENYPVSVLTSFRQGMESIFKGETGILLVDGPPGTGKTHLVRALIHEAPPTVTCVVVPNTVSVNVASPAFMEVLLRQSRTTGSATLLILEDADVLLARRDDHRADASAVTGLLNMSDGILGQMLQVSVLATSNLGKMEMDPAVMRSGRLLAHTTCPALEGAHGVETIRRIMGNEWAERHPPNTHASLASVAAVFSDYCDALVADDLLSRELNAPNHVTLADVYAAKKAYDRKA